MIRSLLGGLAVVHAKGLHAVHPTKPPYHFQVVFSRLFIFRLILGPQSIVVRWNLYITYLKSSWSFMNPSCSVPQSGNDQNHQAKQHFQNEVRRCHPRSSSTHHVCTLVALANSRSLITLAVPSR